MTEHQGGDVSEQPEPPDDVEGSPPDADDVDQRADFPDPGLDVNVDDQVKDEDEPVVGEEQEPADYDEPPGPDDDEEEDTTPVAEYIPEPDDEPDEDEEEQPDTPEGEDARLPAEDPDS